MALTHSQRQKAIRQEQFREYMSKQRLGHKVIDNIAKIEKLAEIQAKDFDTMEEYLAELSTAKDKAAILKMASDLNLKLINKYVGDVKEEHIVESTDAVLNSLSDEELEKIASGEAV